jgi:hypothetical protein
MAKKIKKAPRTTMTEPNAYAARLAKQVTQELSSARQVSTLRKKKARGTGK